MQLNQFRFLIAVDKYGSISKAAQELYISQSTISLSLINLEEELGYVLLNRSKRGVTLTPEGKEVLKRAMVIQETIESLKDINCDDKQIIGDVRIGGCSHLGMNIITDAMLQLKRPYEGIHVFAQRGDIKEVLKKVAQNELDMAFINYHSLQALDVQNDLRRLSLEFSKTYSDKMVICVHEDHPLTWQNVVRMSDVVRYERVTMSPTKDAFMAKHFGYKESDMAVVTLVDVLNLRKYATQTDAVVFLPLNESIRSNKMFPYKLYPLDVEDFDIDITGGWVHHSTHEMNAAEHCVADALANICQQYEAESLEMCENGGA
ncbi:MAG: LysR family transcriptional regulator [Peptococcaceae bacterium]|nr:LysR family transcriptional regulator [Peptococcaceae bacterium]